MTWSYWVPAWFISLVAGILSIYYPYWFIPLVGITLCIFILYCFFLRSFLTIPRLLLILLMIIFCCWVGRIRARSCMNLPTESIPYGKEITLKGVVDDDPIYRSKSVEFSFRSHRIKFIALLPIQTENQPYDLVQGDRFTATGILTADKNPYTSPLSDLKKLHYSNSSAYFLIEDPASVMVNRGNLSSRFNRWINSIRKKAWEKLERYSLQKDYTHFLGALWLGLEKANFPLQSLFQKIGLSHVLAISGSNFFLAGWASSRYFNLAWMERADKILVYHPLSVFLLCFSRISSFHHQSISDDFTNAAFQKQFRRIPFFLCFVIFGFSNGALESILVNGPWFSAIIYRMHRFHSVSYSLVKRSRSHLNDNTFDSISV